MLSLRAHATASVCLCCVCVYHLIWSLLPSLQGSLLPALHTHASAHKTALTLVAMLIQVTRVSVRLHSILTWCCDTHRLEPSGAGCCSAGLRPTGGWGAAAEAQLALAGRKAGMLVSGAESWPPNPPAGAPSPRALECGCIWRQGLQKGD